MALRRPDPLAVGVRRAELPPRRARDLILALLRLLQRPAFDLASLDLSGNRMLPDCALASPNCDHRIFESPPSSIPKPFGSLKPAPGSCAARCSRTPCA